MFHSLQHIADLSEICYQAGIAYVVISPGSRNAPLIDAFTTRFGERCFSIVDERSAAYFGLGLSRENKKPVALICTSGTAVLNYSPALAEAYYQQIQLLAITADRPAEWIDQQDNQTIRQLNVYRNFIKHAVSLPEKITDQESLAFAHTLSIEAIQKTISSPAGPVHINVPLHEPLYLELPSPSADLPVISESATNPELPVVFTEHWEKARSILILHGQDTPDPGTRKYLEQLSHDSRVVILAENISNRGIEGTISQVELFFSRMGKHNLPVPDLLIYSGGQLVSKRAKSVLRNMQIKHTWRVGIDPFEMDTFKQKNTFLPMTATTFYQQLGTMGASGNAGDFRKAWLDAWLEMLPGINEMIGDLQFSDLSVIRDIHEAMPPGTRFELGNSSVIRFSQLLPAREELFYYSNRGVSGIDGCLSAASGTAAASGGFTWIVLGDLSFVYDSNALWNRVLSPKLRIVVLNNHGGGIFGLIDGPGKKNAYNGFFLAHHPVNLQKLAEAFNLNYFCVRDSDELKFVLHELNKDSDAAVLVEVHTEQAENTAVFKKVMQQ